MKYNKERSFLMMKDFEFKIKKCSTLKTPKMMNSKYLVNVI